MRRFLIGSKHIERDSYIWNMLGSTVIAFQSVILLMILTRVGGLASSGTFTIAYTTANLMLTVGKYGMHNFHVSDTAPIFSFGDYRASRWITTLAMLALGVGYALLSIRGAEHSAEKTWVIVWMCVFKAVDAVEDVYAGLYQQSGRLDVSGKMIAVRGVLTVLFFSAVLLVGGGLLTALVLSTVFTVALFLILNGMASSVCRAQIKEKTDFKRVARLLWLCLPLFLIGFLSYYVTNAPKYAIDAMLDDTVQACYGFLAMPVFVVGLVGNYLFNPAIRPLSEHWQRGELGPFRRQIGRQSVTVLAITLICMAGAYLFGTPALSLLYGTDLSAYRTELLVLVASGGFLALANQLLTVITILRRQTLLLIGYCPCALLAALLSFFAVRDYRIMGAAVLELGLTALLCGVFGVILVIEMRSAKTGFKEKGGTQ